MSELDNQIKEALRQRLDALEKHFEGDGIFYFGPFFPSVEKVFREFVEQLSADGENESV